MYFLLLLLCMPLMVIVGGQKQPYGKKLAVHQIHFLLPTISVFMNCTRIQFPGDLVHVVNEESVGVKKLSGYVNSQSEKAVR